MSLDEEFHAAPQGHEWSPRYLAEPPAFALDGGA